MKSQRRNHTLPQRTQRNNCVAVRTDWTVCFHERERSEKKRIVTCASLSYSLFARCCVFLRLSSKEDSWVPKTTVARPHDGVHGSLGA